MFRNAHSSKYALGCASSVLFEILDKNDLSSFKNKQTNKQAHKQNHKQTKQNKTNKNKQTNKPQLQTYWGHLTVHVFHITKKLSQYIFEYLNIVNDLFT